MLFWNEPREFYSNFVFRWTPRIVVGTAVGYYSLGAAYAFGVMAKIDAFAIPIIVGFVGYMGLGAAMPLFQWYSAWGVRIVAFSLAALIYDQSERIVLLAYRWIKGRSNEPKSTIQHI